MGDDIVIRDDLVAASYRRVLQDFGIEISKAKTLVSSDTFEFAKRIFYDGTEVTGFPLNGLVESLISKSWIDTSTVWIEALRRGFSYTW